MLAVLKKQALEKFVATVDWETAKLIAETVQTGVVTLGLLVGGGWAFYKYIIQREGETALDIDLTANAPTIEEGAKVTFFDVVLHNRGKRMVRIPKRTKDGVVYSDAFEELKSALTLQLRRISSKPVNWEFLDWFQSKSLQVIPNLENINLLNEYELENLQQDFWMEPEETYHFGAAVALAPGDYLAKVTFVGRRNGEFWRRIFLVHVPGSKDN